VSANTRGLQLLRSLWQRFPTAPSWSDTQVEILAYQLGRREQEEDELAVFRFITEEFPGSDGAWLNLAKSYERRSELERSREACAEALRLNPDNSDAGELLERLEGAQKTE
jgi:tetratricopeptide (TPR) repeat protein